MSYSIVSLPTTNIGPGYTYLSGAGDLGAFWNKKSVRKRVKARRAARKASGKKKKTGKIIGAVLTGGLSLAFGKKKKGKAKTTPAPLPPVSPPAERPAEETAPTVTEQTSTLQEMLEQQQAALPEAVAFPWIPIAVGVGAVFLIGTIAILAKRG